MLSSSSSYRSLIALLALLAWTLPAPASAATKKKKTTTKTKKTVDPAAEEAATASSAMKAAIFPFEGFELPKEIELAPLGLEKAVRSRMEAAGWELETPPLLLRDMMIAVGCERFDGACSALIGGNLGVDAVVIAKLVTEDRLVHVRLRLWRAEDASLEREIDESFVPDVGILGGSLNALADAFVSGEPFVRPEIKAGSKAPALGADPTPAPKLPLALIIPGAAAAAVGIAGVAIGAVFGLQAMSTRRDLNDNPLVTGTELELAIDQTRTGRRSSLLAGVFLGAGGGLVAAGAGLLLFGIVKPGSKTTAGVVPLKGGALVTIGGTWGDPPAARTGEVER